METEARRLVVAAGGTGGHMFPAQALAEAMSGRGWRVAMITDIRGLRHAGATPADTTVAIPSASLSPRRPVQSLVGVGRIARGMLQARRVFREFQPDVVVGFGGYPSFPAVRTAQAMGLPTVVHEQNTVLGRANRAVALRAHFVASGFEALAKLPPGARHVATGNPIRDQILDAVRDRYTAPTDTGDIHFLAVGGSLGARIIARVVPRAVAALPQALRARLVVVQQTTEGELDAARSIYAAAGVRATCETFFPDIERHLARAHLALGRAGASSVSEFAASGVPTVLVPLAVAMDDHQTANASALARHAAALVVPESAFTPEALTRILSETLHDTHWLESAARAAKAQARPDATLALARLVVEAAG